MVQSLHVNPDGAEIGISEQGLYHPVHEIDARLGGAKTQSSPSNRTDLGETNV